MHTYSNPRRELDPHALPDLEVFQQTAREVAEHDEDVVDAYRKRHEFRLAHINTQVRDKMFDTIIEEEGIQGGWFYWYCFPGCLPDSAPNGPYDSAENAKKAAQNEANH